MISRPKRQRQVNSHGVMTSLVWTAHLGAVIYTQWVESRGRRIYRFRAWECDSFGTVLAAQKWGTKLSPASMYKSQISTAPVTLVQAWREWVPRAQWPARGIDGLAVGSVRDCLKQESWLLLKEKPNIYLSAPHKCSHMYMCISHQTHAWTHRHNEKRVI